MDYSFSEAKCEKCNKYFSNKAAFNAHKVRCDKPPATTSSTSNSSSSFFSSTTSTSTTSSSSFFSSSTSSSTTSSSTIFGTSTSSSSTSSPSSPPTGPADTEDTADGNQARENSSTAGNETTEVAKDETTAGNDATGISDKANPSSVEPPEKIGSVTVKEEPPSDPSVDGDGATKTIRKCAVHNCEITEGTINEEGRLVEFFNFPKGLRLLAKWTKVARPMSPDYAPRDDEVMCEKHFRESDLRMQKLGLIRRADPVTDEEIEEEKKEREVETPARVNVETIVKDVIRFDGQYPYCEASTSSKASSNGDLPQISQSQPEEKAIKKEVDEVKEKAVERQEEPVADDEVNERVINILGAVKQSQMRTARTLSLGSRDLYGFQAKQRAVTTLMRGLSELGDDVAVGRSIYCTGNAERRASKSVKKLSVIVKRNNAGTSVQPSSARQLNAVAASWMQARNSKPLLHTVSPLRQRIQFRPMLKTGPSSAPTQKSGNSESFDSMPKLERSDVATASTSFSEHSYGCSIPARSHETVRKAGSSTMASSSLQREADPDSNAAKPGQNELNGSSKNSALECFQKRRPIVGGTANFTSVKRLKMVETRQGSMEFEVEPNKGTWALDEKAPDESEKTGVRKASSPRRSNIKILPLKKHESPNLSEHAFANGKVVSGASVSNASVTAQKVSSNFIFVNKTMLPQPCAPPNRHIVEHSYGSVKQKKQQVNAEITSSPSTSSSYTDNGFKKSLRPTTAAADFGRRALPADLSRPAIEANFLNALGESRRRDMGTVWIEKPGNFKKENILYPYGKCGIGSLARVHRGTNQTKRGYYRGEGEPRVEHDTLLHPEEDRKMAKEEICYHVQRAILLLDDTCFTKLKLRKDGPIWLTGVSDTDIDGAIDELKGTGFLYPDTEAEDDDETYLFADPLELEDYQVWLAFYRVTEFEYLRHFREEIIN